MKKNRPAYAKLLIVLLWSGFCGLLTSSCSKEIDVNIPDSAEKIVVEGTIETGRPPVIILTKSVKFFSAINVNDIGSYFVHGAHVTVKGDNGLETELNEFCLQNLNLSAENQQLVLNAFGFTNVDSASIPNVCFYTVPDILSYFLSGTCAFMGIQNTTYQLDIHAPPLSAGRDSVHATSSTRIPAILGLDSLSIGIHPNPDYRDSFVPVLAHFTVPDTFGNFVRYWTQRNDEPYYKPLSQSVYDDKLFVGLSIGLPLERGQPDPGKNFNINTYSYFRKGDTVSVKWSNIDNTTYNFFYTLENDGSDSPFSNPVRIKTNITNGLGIWAGYATSYQSIIAPQ